VLADIPFDGVKGVAEDVADDRAVAVAAPRVHADVVSGLRPERAPLGAAARDPERAALEPRADRGVVREEPAAFVAARERDAGAGVDPRDELAAPHLAALDVASELAGAFGRGNADLSHGALDLRGGARDGELPFARGARARLRSARAQAAQSVGGIAVLAEAERLAVLGHTLAVAGAADAGARAIAGPGMRSPGEDEHGEAGDPHDGA
jgi:hypothetical protein